MLKKIFVGIVVFVVLISLAFVFELGGLEWKKFFGPKHEEVKREIWENTPSRVHGATQEISKRMFEYNKAESDVERKAICSTLRTMYSNLNPEVIDDYKLRNFFENCKYGG